MPWLVILLVIALLCVLYLFLICPNLPRRDVGFLLGRDYAHRGLWTDEVPENSLPAFDSACRHGFGIELDVQLTSDGQLAVFHDDCMARMTGDERDIRTCTLAELASLRLKGTNEPIPTFAQVLSVVDGRVPLIVELKTCERIEELCEKTDAMLRAYKGLYCIESFDPRATRWWRLHRPEIIRGTLSCGLSAMKPQDRTLSRRAMAWLLVHVLTRPDFVAYDHTSDSGLSMLLMRRLFHPHLVAWTVRSQQDMDRLRSRYDLQIFERFLPRR